MLAIKRIYSRDRHKMNFVPFIDVVFMLLMYFFVAAEIRPSEGDFVSDVHGEGKGIVPVEKTKEVIRVWVAETAAGPVVRLGGENGRAFASYEDLVGALKGLATVNALVVIDGAPTVSMQTVAYALDATVQAGVPAVTLSR